MCFHKFVDGFGGMGDAVVCGKCGLDKYPEALALMSKLFSGTTRNDGTYGRQHAWPFIIKFPGRISFSTDWTSWTHFMDMHGKMRPRAELEAAEAERTLEGF